MKLTPEQIETIEYYILSWDIKNKDFYEEILDHFISAVEERMVKENESFDYAFPEVTHVFADHIIKPAWFLETFSGLKALELEFQKAAHKMAFKVLMKDALRHLKNGFGLIWLLLALALYVTFFFFSTYVAQAACGLINIVFLMFSPISLKGLKRGYRHLRIKVFRTEASLSLEELKQVKLIPTKFNSFGHVLFLLGFVLSIVNFVNVFDFEISKETIQVGILAYLFLIIPISWTAYKLESKKA